MSHAQNNNQTTGSQAEVPPEEEVDYVLKEAVDLPGLVCGVPGPLIR